MDPNIPNQPIQSEIPVTQPNLQQPVNKIPPSGSKWKLILFIIILLVIAGTGTYYLGAKQNKPIVQEQVTPTIAQSTPTPTPDPTASWKSFTSQKYGFSLKYPTNLVATETFTPFYFVDFKNVNATPGEFPTFELLANSNTFIAKSPAAYDYLSADTVNTFMTMAPNTTRQIDTSIFTKLPDAVVAGQPAIVVTVKSTVDNTTNQKRVFIKNNNNMYMFVNDSNDASNQSDFENLLSSFRFTDQNQTMSTANWKTYTDAMQFFSLSYPPDWSTNQPGGNTASKESIVLGVNGSTPITISVYASNQTPKDWFTTNSNNPPIIQNRMTSIDGSPTYYVVTGINGGQDAYTSKSYILSRSEQIISLLFQQNYTVLGKTTDNSQYASTFDNIVNSIKLLK